jgi:hypothetical protein
MAGTDHSSSLSSLVKTFSQISSLVLALLQFLPAWGCLQKLLPDQPCSSKDTGASTTAGAEAESALVVAQVMTCNITTDAAELQSTSAEDESSSGSALQEDAALLSQQQLQEAQQAAAAAQSRAAELADELRRSQQSAAEAQQKAAMLDDLYQQVCGVDVQHNHDAYPPCMLYQRCLCCCLCLHAGTQCSTSMHC